MTHSMRFRIPLLVVLLAASGIAAFSTGQSATAQAPDASIVKRQQAALLTSGASLAHPGDAPYYQGFEEIRRVVAPVAATVPLPEGGNFNGIHWTDVEGVHMDDILSVLQYNASCQWYRALGDGREADTAREVLRHVPNWPAFRHPSANGHARQLVDVRTDAPVFKLKLQECSGEHAREVSFAKRHGLTPPR